MLQNAVTDTLGTVSELWNGSVLHGFDISPSDGMSFAGSDIFAWGLVGLFALLLIFRDSIAGFFIWLSGFIGSPDQRWHNANALPRFFFPAMYIVVLPVAAFMVYGSSLVEAPYYLILVVIVGYLVVKELALHCIGYVSGNSGLAAALSRLTGVVFFVLVMLAVLLYAVGMFFPHTAPVLISRVAPAVCSVAFLLCFVQVGRIFFSFREPVLFAILYLCTFEILPIGLAVATMVKY